MKNSTIILATNGSQGVTTIRELFALGFSIRDISVITFNSRFNQVFIEFLKFNKMESTIIESDDDLNQYFVNKNFDYLLSISFRYIFCNSALSKIKKAAINFHPGILPFYKGSFSIPWSIIKNEEFVGYSYHYMTEKVDDGSVLLQEKFRINYQTSHTLNYLVFQRGISKLDEVFKRINLNSNNEAYEGGKGRFFSNKLPFNGEINPNWDDDLIERFIRAMYFPPFEPAFIFDSGVKHYFNSYKDYILFKLKRNEDYNKSNGALV